MKDFRDLHVWHKAHQLTLDAYKITASFPKQEMFGMTSQIRRAAVSIAANIAEGWQAWQRGIPEIPGNSCRVGERTRVPFSIGPRFEVSRRPRVRTLKYERS